MSDPKRRFFSADTLQRALVEAANHFGLEPKEIAYRSIEKKHGFLKTRRKVVIEVDPDHPRRAAEARPPAPPPPAAVPPPPELRASSPAPAPAPARPAGQGDRRREGGRERRDSGPRDRGPRRDSRGRSEGGRGERRDFGLPQARTVDEGVGNLVALPEVPRRPSERYPLATGPEAEAAAGGLELLLRVADLRLEGRIHQGEGRLEIELAGEDADRCFEDEGEVLMAIEHLLPRLVRSASGEALPCRVDCDNFHEIREEQIRSLAQRIAGEVRRAGRPRTLEPMSPADRRIVHLTLADDPAVETESDGDGYYKRVTIRPV